MRTEREAGRYEPLNETHRRVAEEEEKRRAAEQEQARSAPAQLEPEPNRPGTDPDHDPDSPEARLAAKEKELQEQVRLGRISPGEMIRAIKEFDNKLVVEMNIEETQRARDQQAPAQQPLDRENSNDRRLEGLPQQSEEARDRPLERLRDDPNRRLPEGQIEREAETAAYEITGRGEMTDARAARLARLRAIDQDIERETRDAEGKGVDRSNDSGDRSR